MSFATTQSNNAGVSNVAVGRGSGTYTAADFVITLGFKPRYFVIENVTDRVKCEWYEGMASGDYIKTVAAGTRTLETSDGVIVNTDGTVSIDVSVDGIQTDNDQIAWMALG